MSLPEEPLSIFSCFGGKARCEGERGIGEPDSICGGSSTSDAPQCAHCRPDHRPTAGYNCSPCDSLDTGILPLTAKLITLETFELSTLCYLYIRFNRPNPSGMVIVGQLIGFVQTIQKLSQLPLLWPEPLQTVLNVLNLLSWTGLLDAAQIHPECVIESSFLYELLRDSLAPLTVCLLYTSPSPRDLSTSRMPSSA